jgi:EpsI family protein
MSPRTLTLLVCLLASAGLVARADRTEPMPIRQPLAQLPMTIGEWQGLQQEPFTKEALAILGVDDYLVRAYLRPDRSGAGLYVGYYKSQRQGDSIHSPLNCLPGAGWEPVSKSFLQLDVPSRVDGPTRTIEVNRYLVQKGADEEQLVLYWYQAHNRVVASEYWGKFYLVADAVRLNRTDGSLVRVMVPVMDGDNREAVAEATAVRFVKALFPLLSNYLPE